MALSRLIITQIRRDALKKGIYSHYNSTSGCYFNNNFVAAPVSPTLTNLAEQAPCESSSRAHGEAIQRGDSPLCPTSLW